MKNQQIVFTAPGKAELLDTEIRAPKEHEVLVQLAYSTISSGTERANLSGDPNNSIYSHDTEAHFPRYCGYCSSGIVVETGSAVTAVKPGDRVANSWGTHCHCLTISEENVHRIENDCVSMRSAAMALIGTFPLAAIRKCHLEIGEAAMVMGQGILGQIAVLLLHQAGAVPIIAVDPVVARRDSALTRGADYALDPISDHFAEQVRSLTHGGVQVAIEVTGLGQGLDNALDCMTPFGRVALLGCTRSSDFSIDYYRKVHGPGISLIGAHTMARPKQESAAGLWTTHDDINALMRLEAAGRIHLEALVGETHRPDEAPEVYTRLLTERTFPVVQFDWSTLN